jgi:hypothetical protein
VCLSWETNASAKTLIILRSTFWALSCVNSNTRHLICNNFNLNFIYGIICLYVCVCAFSLHRESPNMILRDKPLISKVVLSHPYTALIPQNGTNPRDVIYSPNTLTRTGSTSEEGMFSVGMPHLKYRPYPE